MGSQPVRNRLMSGRAWKCLLRYTEFWVGDDPGHDQAWWGRGQRPIKIHYVLGAVAQSSRGHPAGAGVPANGRSWPGGSASPAHATSETLRGDIVAEGSQFKKRLRPKGSLPYGQDRAIPFRAALWRAGPAHSLI
jgi:hypothetical protein